jgi:hypothetical protein
MSLAPTLPFKALFSLLVRIFRTKSLLAEALQASTYNAHHDDRRFPKGTIVLVRDQSQEAEDGNFNFSLKFD